MADRPLVLSLVERGWQAARDYSLQMQPQADVVHVVKGRLSRNVRRMIAPSAHIRVLSMPRALFWPGIGLLLLGYRLSGRLRTLLVDNRRSYRRLARVSRAARLGLALIQQGASGYELSAEA